MLLLRQQQQQHIGTGRARFDGSSTYARDFGAAGSDPMSRAASSPQQQALMATTRELSSGTTRASPARPPGFTGFIPACKDNAAAVAHGAGTEPRPDDAKVRGSSGCARMRACPEQAPLPD